jgi:hypothetical protein
MTKLKAYTLRFQAIVLATLVAMLSMGFTYQWEVCAHAEEVPVCKLVEDAAACCCAIQLEAPQCTCADMSHNTCDISFSKYVQFDFEVLTSDFQELVSDVNSGIASALFNLSIRTKFSPPVREYVYSLPPPKSGRDIICSIQSFLI